MGFEMPQSLHQMRIQQRLPNIESHKFATDLVVARLLNADEVLEEVHFVATCGSKYLGLRVKWNGKLTMRILNRCRPWGRRSSKSGKQAYRTDDDRSGCCA
jgi:hypothetical protein